MSLLAMAALQLHGWSNIVAAEEEGPGGTSSRSGGNLKISTRQPETHYVGGAGSTYSGRDDLFAFRIMQRDTQRRRSLYAARPARHRHGRRGPHQYHPYRAPTNASWLTNPSLVESGLRPPSTWTVPLTTDSLGQSIVTIQIGGSANVPPLTQTLVVDTGSSITWVQCQPHNLQQHPQKDPLYDLRKTRTFKYIECTDARCELLSEQNRYCEDATNYCVFGKTYADQSTIWGMWGLDTISMGSWKAEDVPIGCAYSSHLAYIQDVAGFLGFGQGRESIVSTKGSSFGNSFSYCLPRKDSKGQ
ncbi:hypothetical protein L7F22_035247 [Adiantum nelumboides]|nr:hypothetical protein [Adiantum nelumboides]